MNGSLHLITSREINHGGESQISDKCFRESCFEEMSLANDAG
jgi:hypothetical protein